MKRQKAELDYPFYDFSKFMVSDGCDLHNHCLTCPFEKCRYDEPLHLQKQHKRNEEIRKLRAAGASSEFIATWFHISERSVFRALSS